MYHPAYQIPRRWLDQLKLAYWRQLVRLTRTAARLQVAVKEFQALVVPIRGYLWLPLIAGIVGMIIGLLIVAI